MSGARGQSQVISSLFTVLLVVGTVTTVTVAGVALMQQQANTLSGTPVSDIASCVDDDENVTITHRGGDELQRDDLIAVFQRGSQEDIVQLSTLGVNETLSRGETWEIPTDDVPDIALKNGVPTGRLELRHNPTNTLVLGSTSLGRCDDAGPDVNIVQPGKVIQKPDADVNVTASDSAGVDPDTIRVVASAGGNRTVVQDLSRVKTSDGFTFTGTFSTGAFARGANVTIRASVADNYSNYGDARLDAYIQTTGGPNLTLDSADTVGESTVTFTLVNYGDEGTNVTSITVTKFENGDRFVPGNWYVNNTGGPTFRAADESTGQSGVMNRNTTYSGFDPIEIGAGNTTSFELGAFRNDTGTVNLAVPNVTIELGLDDESTETFVLEPRLADPGFAYRDLDNNGVWNPGTDERIEDIQSVVESGSYDAENDLVIPSSVGNISVGGSGNVDLSGDNVTLGTSVDSQQDVSITAENGTLNAADVSLTSNTKEMTLSGTKGVLLNGSTITAKGVIDVNSEDGYIYAVNASFTSEAGKGGIQLRADGDIRINGSYFDSKKDIEITSVNGDIYAGGATFEGSVTMSAENGSVYDSGATYN